jgi:hypothetical protein
VDGFPAHTMTAHPGSVRTRGVTPVDAHVRTGPVLVKSGAIGMIVDILCFEEGSP